jgi:hypothetical protein
VATAPAAGQEVAFDLTDVGRVALGGTMGPAIARIEGRLVRHDSSDYLVSVKAVDFISGSTQVWSGEPVHLKPEYIANTFERRLSKSRTLTAVAVGVGAVALIVTTSLVAGGTGDTRQPPTDTLGTTSRGRRP